MNLNNKVNEMHPTYAIKLGFCTKKIGVSAQKIDGSHLDIFKIVIADGSVKEILKRVRFFQETFLLANIDLDVVLGMFFLTLSRANIWFAKLKFVQETYTAAETLTITRPVEIIDKREFVAIVLNADNKIFALYVVALTKLTIMPIYPSCQA